MDVLEISCNTFPNKYGRDENSALIDETIGFAKHYLRTNGNFASMAWLLTDDTIRIYVGNFAANDDTKLVYSQFMRGEVKRHNPYAYIFICEAWMISHRITKDATPEETAEVAEALAQEAAENPIRNREDKEEVLMCSFEFLNEENVCVHIYVDRDEGGNIVKLRDGETMTGGKQQGRMMNMLNK